MKENQSSWPSFNSTETNSSHFHRGDQDATASIYLFTPAGDTSKLILCLTLSTVGVIGFLGNCSIFYFLGQKPPRNQLQSNQFVRNLNIYIRSSSLSDLLSCGISVPLTCIQISYDVFQSGWACRTVRYIQFIFLAFTVNTLLVVSLEKYLSTRKVLRSIGTSKMRTMVAIAWVLGLVLMLPAAAAYDGQRVNLNDTHFTIICKNDEQFFPFRITLVVLPIQYVIPSIIVVYANICLARAVWGSGRRHVTNVVKNSFQNHLLAKKVRGTTLLIALTFAFIVPFFFFLGNMAYTQIAKPQRDFSTAYMVRYGTGVIVYLSPVFNFMIYFVQRKDFRDFLWKLLRKQNSQAQLHKVVVTEKRSQFLDVMKKQNATAVKTTLEN